MGSLLHVKQRTRGGGVHKNKKPNKPVKTQREKDRKKLSQQETQPSATRQQITEDGALGTGCGTRVNISPEIVEKVTLLSNLILWFREHQGAGIVRPRQVVPDFASLADTRLDVESLAKSMQDCGVQKSLGSQECVTLDDSSFVVREPPNSDYRKKALKVCTKRVEHERGLPPVRV